MDQTAIKQKKTIRRFFFVWDYEKEERWLNDMSQKGWQLRWASIGRYVFEKGEPGEYNYRLELLENDPNSKENLSYILFLKETGIEMAGECKNWIYLRQKASEGDFEPANKPLNELTHVMKIQDFLNKFRNRLITLAAFSILALLILEELKTSNYESLDFLRGFCTGLALSSSFISVAFVPMIKKNDKRIKKAVRELYTCE
jgi:hypothetical protein